MNPLRKLLSLVHWLEDSMLVLALVSMLVMAMLQIVLRNFFDSGFLWAETFLRILVLWVAMLGAMVATREKNHISIDLLSRNLHSKWLLPIELLTSSASMSLCFTAAWFSVEYIQYEYQDGTIAFASVPVWLCQSIIPVGFVVMGLRFCWYPFRKAA
ncbi:MAG: TRAP transporter small permease [Proteobacteria bacterium]|nr:TRAP transporter small permease [Pseudomonadota bacterium]